MFFIIIPVVTVLHPGRIIVCAVRLMKNDGVLQMWRPVKMVPGLRNISMVIAIYKTGIMGVLVIWVVMDHQVSDPGDPSKVVVADQNTSCLDYSSIIIIINRNAFDLDYCSKIIKLYIRIIIITCVITHIDMWVYP